MATFVLVPGAWLGAWAWRRVTPLLRAAGHDVHPVTLTGLGDRAHLGGASTDMSTHAHDVVALLEAEELTEVILVGHSYAGAVVTVVAGQVPERIAELVYLDAEVPAPGVSLFDSAGADYREYMEARARAAGDPTRMPFLTDDELDQFYGEHGLGGDDLRWLRVHAVSLPMGTSTEPVGPGPDLAAVPHTFIRCTGTPGPGLVEPGLAGWEYAELPTGHWPMVTLPDELARLLDERAQRRDPAAGGSPQPAPSPV